MALKHKLINLGEWLTAGTFIDEYTMNNPSLRHLLVYTVPERTVSRIIAFSNSGGSLYWSGRNIEHPNRRLKLLDLTDLTNNYSKDDNPQNQPPNYNEIYHIERWFDMNGKVKENWHNKNLLDTIIPDANMISGVHTLPQYLAPGDKVYWGGYKEPSEDIMTTFRDVKDGEKINYKVETEVKKSKNGVLYLFIDEIVSDPTNG